MLIHPDLQLTPTANAAWTAYGKCSDNPRVDIGWREYLGAGGPTIYIGKPRRHG